MREILFRGKRVGGGKWVEGSLLSIGEERCIVEDGDVSVDIAWYCDGTCTKVEPETVGQFTGLTDKNGKKIFEGDVVKMQYWFEKDGRKFIVKFVHDRGGWFPFANGDGCGCCEDETICPNENGIVNDVQVIGNIHDNPELVEVAR